MQDMQPNCLYRIAYNCQAKDITGQPAVYLRDVWHCGCRWAEMDVYGRSGVYRYLVKHGQIIPNPPYSTNYGRGPYS